MPKRSITQVSPAAPAHQVFAAGMHEGLKAAAVAAGKEVISPSQHLRLERPRSAAPLPGMTQAEQAAADVAALESKELTYEDDPGAAPKHQLAEHVWGGGKRTWKPSPPLIEGEPVSVAPPVHAILVNEQDIYGAATRLVESAEDPYAGTPEEWCQAMELYLRQAINEILSAPAYYAFAHYPMLSETLQMPAGCVVRGCEEKRLEASRFCEKHVYMWTDPNWTAQPLPGFRYIPAARPE